MKNKYLWYTDCHLDKILPWSKMQFITHIVKENPAGVFLSGDISNSLMTVLDLKMLATLIKCPIYFVLGNHDYHFSSFAKTHEKIRELCKKHSNLIWLTEADVMPLSSDVAIIGTEGWYNAFLGNPKYLIATFDWFMIKELRQLPNMRSRIEAFQKLSETSCKIISSKLQAAINQNYNHIYMLTHIPPWVEATRDVGGLLENYWLPYNSNILLGKTIEKIMVHYPDVKLTVLAGHTHTDCWVNVAHNIECKVNKDKYYGLIRSEERIII